MECNCPRCLGIGDGLPQGYVEPPEEERELTVYEKLVALEEKLKFYSTQNANDLIQMVVDLADEIDSIDSEVIKLQKKYDIVELGELSKKLY